MTLRLAAALPLVLLAACGDTDERPRIAAAASLETAFSALAGSGATRPSFSFGGSDTIAAQIRAGARPDLYAAADARLPAALHAEGHVERPVPFASNELVIAVPARSPLRELADLSRGDLDVVVGAGGVPAGAYARVAIAALPPGLSSAISASIRSEEPDAAAVAAKVAAGGADAGFVYASEVRASSGRLRAIRLPPAARPPITYSAAVVRDSPRRAAARAFLAALRGPEGRAALARAGLTPVEP